MITKGHRGHKVVIRVVSQQGYCMHGHKVGDEWVFDETTPAGMCSAAFNDLLPYIWVLRWGGTFPWMPDPDAITNVACSDGNNPVLFDLKRLRG